VGARHGRRLDHGVPARAGARRLAAEAGDAIKFGRAAAHHLRLIPAAPRLLPDTDPASLTVPTSIPHAFASATSLFRGRNDVP
jgi:hypothetical protein